VPQQNGVVERKNRTLVEMARTMLDEHMTPRHYFSNRIPTLTLEFGPLLSFALDINRLFPILGHLVANVLSSNMVTWINLNLAL
jgi:hypothetical protein